MHFPVRISIHALHEESDRIRSDGAAMLVISIHALHEESDLIIRLHQINVCVISIHALHEESDAARPVSRRI